MLNCIKPISSTFVRALDEINTLYCLPENMTEFPRNLRLLGKFNTGQPLSNLTPASHRSEISFLEHSSSSPNVVAEWLAVLLRIREISDSNLGPKTGCPD
jgi:hypothetical protein